CATAVASAPMLYFESALDPPCPGRSMTSHSPSPRLSSSRHPSRHTAPVAPSPWSRRYLCSPRPPRSRQSIPHHLTLTLRLPPQPASRSSSSGKQECNSTAVPG